MADKTDEPTTPTPADDAASTGSTTAGSPTGESPVYDSLVEEPVVATVDADTPPELVEPLPEEPEEIVVEEADAVEYVDDEPVTASEATAVYEQQQAPVYQQPEPVAAPQPQVVYREAPKPPVDKSNRGFGVLIAIAASVVFIVVLVVVMAIVYGSLLGQVNLGFLGQTAFYVPALFFAIGLVVLVLILNRAGWWTYVIGSIVVALFVYFGTIGTLLLGAGVVMQTPEVAAEQFRQGLVDPFSIASALVAREVAIWAGAIIASRGRKLKTRNAEARAEFQREQAQARAY
jgi:hypothetical protein